MCTIFGLRFFSLFLANFIHSLEINYDFLLVGWLVQYTHIFGSKCYKNILLFNAYIYAHTLNRNIPSLRKWSSSLLADFSSSHINVNANLYFLNGLHDFSRRSFVWRNNIIPPPSLSFSSPLPLMLATRHKTHTHNVLVKAFWPWHHFYKHNK